MLNTTIHTQRDDIYSYIQNLGFPTKDNIKEEEKKILLTAFVHKSYASDFIPALEHNERLEFLGDGILGACIADILYQEQHTRDESQMTLYKIALVREEMLAQIARSIQLGEYINLSKGEEKQGGKDKDAILADSLESVIGALHLLYGFDLIYRRIYKVFVPLLQQLKQTDCKSYKSLLQERVQHYHKTLPVYHTIEHSEGKQNTFESQVFINETCYGIGKGKNKKRAHEQAAYAAYSKLSETIT